MPVSDFWVTTCASSSPAIRPSSIRSSAPPSSTSPDTARFPALTPALVPGSGVGLGEGGLPLRPPPRGGVVRCAPLLGVAIPRRGDAGRAIASLGARGLPRDGAEHRLSAPRGGAGGVRRRQGGRVARCRSTRRRRRDHRGDPCASERLRAQSVSERRSRGAPGLSAIRSVFGGSARCRPTAVQELLLKSCLAAADDALAAWERWCAGTDLDRIDEESFRLLPLAWYRLQDVAPRDRTFEIAKGVYRRAWYRNQLLFRDAERYPRHARGGSHRRDAPEGQFARDALLPESGDAADGRPRRPGPAWRGGARHRPARSATAGNPSSKRLRTASSATRTRSRSCAIRPTSICTGTRSGRSGAPTPIGRSGRARSESITRVDRPSRSRRLTSSSTPACTARAGARTPTAGRPCRSSAGSRTPS